MPRTVEVIVPAGQSDLLLQEIQKVPGLLSLSILRGAGVQPPGDEVVVTVTNRGLDELMNLLDQHGVAKDAHSSLKSSEPLSVISQTEKRALVHDSSESSWEEMETNMVKESHMTRNAVALMFVSGIFSAVGLGTSTLHLVLAAMVVAPGFEPIVRVGLGVITQSGAWRRGLVDLFKGYLALVLGGALTALVLLAVDRGPLAGQGTYLPGGVLVDYWSSFSVPTLLVSFAAGIAGSILVATNRTILTLGVMIALALIPTATLVGMAAITGNLELLVRVALRWLADVGLVVFGSLIVFAWKRTSLQRRRMLL